MAPAHGQSREEVVICHGEGKLQTVNQECSIHLCTSNVLCREDQPAGTWFRLPALDNGSGSNT